MSMDASSSPNPKWEARAARPMPAARPARGPIQERLGWAWGAAAAAAGEWLEAGAAAWLGAAGPGVTDFWGLTASRCIPEDLPPPRRRAASASPVTSVKPRTRAAEKSAKDFILVSWLK